jgi:ribosomal subunit interface protein
LTPSPTGRVHLVMQVLVTGRHVDVGDALRTRVSDDLTSSIGKYFERGGAADVVVARDGHAFKVDCVVNLASGQQLQSHGLGGDAYAAFNAALQKIEARVRRYKRRLKDHHPAALAKQAEAAAYFVIRSPEEVDLDLEDDGLERVDGAEEGAMIIAETEKAIRTMTVSMAVMDLDLTESQTIVFRNAAHGGLSVVYRRPDGNIGWIDPERTKPVGNGADAR